jgi:hypothetical protein
MTDYAAAPLQPIANCVIDVLSPTLFDGGQGILSVVRTPAGAPLFGSAAGDFLITLDPGLPGDVGLDGNFGRTTLTQRGTLGLLAGGTTITGEAVSYPSQTTVRVVFTVGTVATDPAETEVLIWRGN